MKQCEHIEPAEIRTCGATISLQLMMKWLLLFQVMAQKNGLITETFFSDSMVDNCAASATCIRLMLLCIMLFSFLMVKMAGTQIYLHTIVQLEGGGLLMLVKCATMLITCTQSQESSHLCFGVEIFCSSMLSMLGHL